MEMMKYYGTQNTETLLLKFIQNLLILKAMKSVSLCILLNESDCLCYRVMLVCMH